MIAADVPGTYIFHREEEIGGKGSGWIADNKDNWLSNYSSCIAFDRYGNNSIITHQGMERTCFRRVRNRAGQHPCHGPPA